MTRPPLPGPDWRYIEGAELEKPLPMDAKTWNQSDEEWNDSIYRGFVTHHKDAFYITRALQAEPTDSEPNGGWMPIESAPRDGTRILFYDPLSSGLIHSGNWEAEFEPERWDKRKSRTIYRGAWTDHSVASFGYEELNEFNPTHWQPLPAPPAAAMKEKL